MIKAACTSLIKSSAISSLIKGSAGSSLIKPVSYSLIKGTATPLIRSVVTLIEPVLTLWTTTASIPPRVLTGLVSCALRPLVETASFGSTQGWRWRSSRTSRC